MTDAAIQTADLAELAHVLSVVALRLAVLGAPVSRGEPGPGSPLPGPVQTPPAAVQEFEDSRLGAMSATEFKTARLAARLQVMDADPVDLRPAGEGILLLVGERREGGHEHQGDCGNAHPVHHYRV